MTAFSHNLTDWRIETRSLLRLAGPLIINYLAIAGINFADATMAGRLGAKELAAVAVGGSVWMLCFIIALGILMAISPIVSRHHGAGNQGLIGRYTRQGLYLSQLMGFGMLAASRVIVDPLLEFVGVDAGFRDLTGEYVKAIMFGMPGMCAYLALRFTTEGIGETRPVMYSSIIALVVNVTGNYVLMFGNFGAPALGAVGCGIASAIAMTTMFVFLLVYMYRHSIYKPLKIFVRVSPLHPEVLKEIVVLGAPIAVTITAETGLFAGVSLLMGTLGAEIAAAHQIAINFASTMFMVPLALSAATTIRVGHALGRSDVIAARFSGWVGIGVCGLFMMCSALFMLVMRDAVVSLYTDDSSVQHIAISLLLMAALFQVSDGLQIGATAALRGYKDMRVPMYLTTITYWGLAFPLAYMAAVTYRMPPHFIWGGFVIGLSIAAVVLGTRYYFVANRYVRDGIPQPS